ncbi:hypothetical protein BH11VER1_BH11VER1_41720 [soil metagenome]
MFSLPIIRLSALAIATFLFSSCQAAEPSPLQWDKTEATLNAAAGETRTEAVFTLKNNSDKPVTILRMEMDCSCLQESTGIIGRAIEANASSRMVITFTPGLLTKAGDHKIAIHTDLQTEPSVITVHTRSVPLITLEPEVPSWKQGEAPVEKSILIKSVKDLEIKGLQSTSSDFESRIETVEAGKQWKLFIRPKDTSTTRGSLILLQTNWPTAPWSQLSIAAKISPK